MNVFFSFAVVIAFGLCAWFGTILAARICARRVPFEDGPRPITAHAWPFALSGAALGAATVLHTTDIAYISGLASVTLLLAACAFADLRWGVIPDAFSLPALAAVALLAVIRHDVSPLFGAAIIGLPFAAAAVFSLGRGMGWGDVKLALFGGALLGARDATLAFCGACIAAYVGALITRRVREPLALGPYLVAAVAAAIALDPVR